MPQRVGQQGLFILHPGQALVDAMVAAQHHDAAVVGGMHRGSSIEGGLQHSVGNALLLQVFTQNAGALGGFVLEDGDRSHGGAASSGSHLL
ncbi:hypothetical protein HQS1_33100 [Delftia lacustris]|nr:hypothetical protein HQS1_33100 [Delftia lacustris]